jgi:hypothetical protein
MEGQCSFVTAVKVFAIAIFKFSREWMQHRGAMMAYLTDPLCLVVLTCWWLVCSIKTTITGLANAIR